MGATPHRSVLLDGTAAQPARARDRLASGRMTSAPRTADAAHHRTPAAARPPRRRAARRDRRAARHRRRRAARLHGLQAQLRRAQEERDRARSTPSTARSRDEAARAGAACRRPARARRARHALPLRRPRAGRLRASAPPRPVVVGFGPCGIFAALVLAQMGFRPIVLERGKAVRERTSDTWGLWRKRRARPGVERAVRRRRRRHLLRRQALQPDQRPAPPRPQGARRVRQGRRAGGDPLRRASRTSAPSAWSAWSRRCAPRSSALGGEIRFGAARRPTC